MLIYDQVETSIQQDVITAIMTVDNQFDKFIDDMLNKLMITDAKWGEGGTNRIHKDKYQEYLKTNGIPLLEDKINKTLSTIVEDQNNKFQKKLVQHLKSKQFNAAELETLEQIGISVDKQGVCLEGVLIGGSFSIAAGGCAGVSAAFAEVAVGQLGARMAGAAIGGVVAVGLLTVGTGIYYIYQASWTRKTATEEIAYRMKQDMRNRVMTYVGITKRSFRELGLNSKYYIISEEFKSKKKEKYNL